MGDLQQQDQVAPRIAKHISQTTQWLWVNNGPVKKCLH
jgi:hypothetical protein